MKSDGGMREKDTQTHTRDHARPPMNKGCFPLLLLLHFDDFLCCSSYLYDTHIRVYIVEETLASCHMEKTSQRLYHRKYKVELYKKYKAKYVAFIKK